MNKRRGRWGGTPPGHGTGYHPPPASGTWTAVYRRRSWMQHPCRHWNMGGWIPPQARAGRGVGGTPMNKRGEGGGYPPGRWTGYHPPPASGTGTAAYRRRSHMQDLCRHWNKGGRSLPQARAGRGGWGYPRDQAGGGGRGTPPGTGRGTDPRMPSCGMRGSAVVSRTHPPYPDVRSSVPADSHDYPPSASIRV
jgi:hypothetical protein